MAIDLPEGFYWDDGLKADAETLALAMAVWPKYLVDPSDIPEPSPILEFDPQKFYSRYPLWGIRHKSDRRLVAYINAVQIALDLEQEQLPDSGWRFAIQAGSQNVAPNALCLLAANVDLCARGARLSTFLIERAKQAARELGFSTLVAPVRPILKHQFLSLSMENYVAKKKDNGEPFDPWIALHVRSGGEVRNICHTSVLVRASLPKWRDWTGLALTQAGEVLLPEGLAPLLVDLEQNLGTYCEPNVWVRYLIHDAA